MRIGHICFLASLVAPILVGNPVWADNIITSTGLIGGAGGDVAEIGFTLANPFTDVSISISGSDASGSSPEAYLTNAIGTGTTNSALLSSTSFSASGSSVASYNLFSGVSLAAGTYYLTIYDSTGNFSWAIGNTGYVTGAGVSNVTVGDDYNTTDNTITPYATNFDGSIQGKSQTLLVSITGTGSAVPEPTTLALVGMGVIGLIGARRRRR